MPVSQFVSVDGTIFTITDAEHIVWCTASSLGDICCNAAPRSPLASSNRVAARVVTMLRGADVRWYNEFHPMRNWRTGAISTALNAMVSLTALYRPLTKRPPDS